jgi:hypothetical protein
LLQVALLPPIVFQILNLSAFFPFARRQQHVDVTYFSNYIMQYVMCKLVRHEFVPLDQLLKTLYMPYIKLYNATQPAFEEEAKAFLL